MRITHIVLSCVLDSAQVWLDVCLPKASSDVCLHGMMSGTLNSMHYSDGHPTSCLQRFNVHCRQRISLRHSLIAYSSFSDLLSIGKRSALTRQHGCPSYCSSATAACMDHCNMAAVTIAFAHTCASARSVHYKRIAIELCVRHAWWFL